MSGRHAQRPKYLDALEDRIVRLTEQIDRMTSDLATHCGHGGDAMLGLDAAASALCSAAARLDTEIHRRKYYKERPGGVEVLR